MSTLEIRKYVLENACDVKRKFTFKTILTESQTIAKIERRAQAFKAGEVCSRLLRSTARIRIYLHRRWNWRFWTHINERVRGTLCQSLVYITYIALKYVLTTVGYFVVKRLTTTYTSGIRIILLYILWCSGYR